MPLSIAGRDFLVGAAFDTISAYIGVGDSTAAFDTTQTDLQAAVNKFRKGMDAGYPTRVANTVTFQSTFTGTEANFAWSEWGIFNASADGTMVSRKVEDNGVKSAGQTWVFQTQLTINFG